MDVKKALLIVIALSLALSFGFCDECTSSGVVDYAESFDNASLAVLIEIDVIANSILSGVYNSTLNGTGNSTELYQALASALNVEFSNNGVASFEDALEQITNSYFQSCYGVLEERPTPSEVGSLVYSLITKLQNLTAENTEVVAEVRKIFGRLACLIDTYGNDELRSNSTTSSPAPSSSTPAGPTPTPTVSPPTSAPINCSNLGGTFINIDVFYACVHSDDLKPIFGIGPITTIGEETVILKRCIGFVVDTTGSMSSEISYVRQLILDFLNSESIVPACYALVDFNDYGYSSPELNVGTAKIYDPLIEYSTEESALTLSTGGTVYGAQNLRDDVNALYAHSGGDCPEYGMTGILKVLAAIKTVEGIILPTTGNLHHVIVLTDASAKDDSRYQEVINSANTAKATVHFFYSGSYCGTLANYETVRTSTGGIRVDSISDFGAFATFINTYNSAGASRRRRSSLFTECAPTHSLNTTHFTTSLNILISTCHSQSYVYVTKPDGTTQSLYVSGSLILYSIDNPPPGTWMAYVPSGHIKVSVSESSHFMLDISYTVVEDGKIVPTADIPQACSAGTIIATSPQLHLLSPNHTLHLNVLNDTGQHVAQTILERCSNVLSGDISFPSSSTVFYQLNGYDISNNPFSLILSGYDGLTFQPPSLDLTLNGIETIYIVPSQATQVSATLQYSVQQGQQLGLVFQGISSLPSQVSISIIEKPDTIEPAGTETILFDVSALGSLSPGSSLLTLNISITDSCKSHKTNFSLPLFVCNPISQNVTNVTFNAHSLLVKWNEPSSVSEEIATYEVSSVFDNGTSLNRHFDNSTFNFTLSNLEPYQLIRLNVIAYSTSGNKVGCSSIKNYRSKESVPSQVSFLNYSYPTNTSIKVCWGEPISSNGVLLYYQVVVKEIGSTNPIINVAIEPHEERCLAYNSTGSYLVNVKAATSQGLGIQSELTIYPEGLIVTNIEGTALTSSSIYLSWSSPILPNNSHYVIKVDELVTSRIWHFYSVEKFATVLSLHPYYNYICQIAIVVDTTIYPFSPAITVQTLQSAPTAAPMSLSHYFISSQELNLTWLPPPFEKQNGLIQYYTIEVTELETGLTNNNNSYSTSVLLENLHPFYNYKIIIKTVTIAPGPTSTAYYITMPEAAPSSSPSNVTSYVINSTALAVFWSPPSFEHRNGIIREYLVEVFEVVTGSTISVSVSGLSTTFTSLHPNYQYYVTIRALTVAYGPVSDTLILQTEEDAPSGSPETFNATILSPYSAYLMWDPPPIDQQNGVIIGYTINVTILETTEDYLLFSNTMSLFVDDLIPFKTFQCIIAAVTNVGIGPFSSVFAITTPEDAPASSPVHVRTVAVLSDSFSLQWDPPLYEDQNGIIKHYIIRVLEVETGLVTQYTSYNVYLTLSSLHPAYTYACSIAAFTVGLGPFTIELNVTTNEEAPSQSPQDLSQDMLTSYSVSLSWNPPPLDGQNGAITSYQLNITSLATGYSFVHTSNITSTYISGLSPYTTYSCIVAAETSIGRGPYTTILTFTTDEDAPNSPPVVTTYFVIDSRSIAIQWTPPTLADHNGIIRKYVVRLQVSGTTDTITYNTTGTTAIIGSLIPSYSYKIAVAAYTITIGPFTSFMNLTLPEDAPSGYPQDLSINSTTPYSITLTWASPPPDERNGEIVAYVVNITHSDTLMTMQYHTNVTTIHVTGLDPYTTYVCVVAAKTSVGIGPFSHLFFVQTDEAAPGSPPQHPNAIALSATSIHISWDPPILQDHNGIIREYHVNVTEAASLSITEHIVNQTQLIVTGLKPFHAYYCSIQAVTVDEGPFTVSVSVLTEEAAPSLPPNSLEVIVTSSHSAVISWDPPPAESHNGIIRDYLVVIHHVLTGADDSFTAFGNVLNVSSLIPFTQYKIKVAAVTVKAGPFTIEQNITTFQDEPTSPPELFNATASDSSQLFLQWFPPTIEETNGIIQYYNVTITEIETGIVTDYATSAVAIVINDLHPFFTYKCTVAAVTIGKGPIASLVIQMPEDAPSNSPNNFLNTAITSSSLSLSWDSLSLDHQNGIVRYYIINVTENDTGSQFQILSYNLYTTLSNLHPYYTYSVSVAAYTISPGPFSSPLILTTAEDVPSSFPVSLNVAHVNSFEAVIEWLPLPLSERNGIIVGYNVSIEDSVAPGSAFFLLTSSMNITIGSLEPYTTYQYKVAAYTAVGLGPYSDQQFFQTLESAPSQAPDMPTILDITSTSLTLTWQYPSIESRNGIIRKFIVKLIDGRSGVQSFYNVTSTTVTLSDLRPHHNYNISVSAFTTAIGPYSEYIPFSTDEAVPTAPPNALSIVAINASTLNLYWSPPNASRINGIIRHYIVNVSVMETLEQFQYTTLTNNLTIHDLHPYYTYTVLIAAFTIGIGPFTAGSSIQMPQHVPSGPPQNVTGVVINSTAIQVSWDPPLTHMQNGVITSYTISVLELITSKTLSFQQNPFHSNYIISGLHPYYRYEITVAAITVGIGPGASTTLTTKQDSPSGPPQNVTVNVTSSTTAFLQWSPPSNDVQNGIILYYEIFLYNFDTSFQVINVTQQTSVLLTGLQPFYTYNCSVRAFTIGQSPLSTTLQFQMFEDVPSGSPMNLSVTSITSTSAVLSWYPPLAINLNGILTDYTIRVIKGQNSEPTVLTTANTSLIVTSLEPYSQYSYTVSASTSQGQGPFSNYLSFQTNEDAPSSAPYSLLATSITSTSFILQWQTPSSSSLNGELTGFNVIIEELNTDTTYQNFTKTPSILLSYLHPYYTYNCSVTSITVSAGPYSDKIMVQTSQSAPSGPPLVVTITSLSSQSVTVSWSPPSANQTNGLIQHYTLVLYELLTGKTYSYQTNETSLVSNNLHPYYTYSVSVAATTVAIGPYSTNQTFSTLEDTPVGTPQNLMISTINSTSLLFQWSSIIPNMTNGLIMSYTIKVFEVESNLTSSLLYTTNLNVTLLNLHPYYNYHLFVAGTNVIGTGPFAQSEGQTEAAAPSAPPQNLSSIVLSSSEVNVNWLPPPATHINGPLSHYMVSLSSNQIAGNFEYNSTMPSINITNLHPFYYYYCYVTAVTVGFGPSALISFQMAEDVPSGPPRNFSVVPLNYSSLFISWLPPHNSLQNGIIRRYDIHFQHNAMELTDIYTVSNATTLIINDLKPYSTYVISVAAFTVGLGPFTTSLSILLPEAAPSAPPVNFVAQIIGNNSGIQFTWIQPQSDQLNGILLGYKLNCSEQNGHQVNYNIFGTTAFFNEIHTNTHYTCYICAYTSFGCGPAAAAHISTYQNSLVGPPQSVTAKVNSTGIHLHWESPFDPYSVVTSYAITYQLISTNFAVSTPRPTVTVSNINDTNYFLQPLLVSSTYVFKIVAITNESTSPMSEPLAVTTNPSDLTSPQNLKCSADISISLSCTWTAPVLSNSDLEYYLLSFRLLDGFDYYPGYGTTLGTETLESNIQEYDIDNLLPYAGYIVEIKAFFSPLFGSGLSSGADLLSPENIMSSITTLNLTRAEVPSTTVENIEVAVMSPNSIQISWKPPKRKFWNGQIDHYSIIVMEQGDNGIEKRATAPRNINVMPENNDPDPSLAIEPLKREDYLLEGLEENFEYTISISVVNTAGNGLASDPLQQKMPEAAPSGPPINITIQSVSLTSINITWQPPNPYDANGVITGYKVVFTRAEINEMIEYTLPSYTNYFYKNGLHSYEEVTIKVAAKTEVGIGPYSILNVFYTSEDVPNTPSSLKATLINETSALLQWDPLLTVGSILEYQVIYSGYSDTRIDGPYVMRVSDSTAPQLTINKLLGGYIYQFTVRCKNNAGYSGNVTTILRIPAVQSTIRTDANVGLTQNNIIAIAIPIGSIILVVLCALIVCVIVRGKKSKRSDSRNLAVDPPFINPLTQLPIDEIGPDVPLKSVHLKSIVFENTYEDMPVNSHVNATDQDDIIEDADADADCHS